MVGMLALLVAALPAAARTLRVAPAGRSRAVEAARPGDTVLIAPGTDHEAGRPGPGRVDHSIATGLRRFTNAQRSRSRSACAISSSSAIASMSFGRPTARLLRMRASRPRHSADVPKSSSRTQWGTRSS
jgi:hypothetical protein